MASQEQHGWNVRSCWGIMYEDAVTCFYNMYFNHRNILAVEKLGGIIMAKNRYVGDYHAPRGRA